MYPKGNDTKMGNTMTYQDDLTFPPDLLELVTEQCLDFLPELIHIVINTGKREVAAVIRAFLNAPD